MYSSAPVPPIIPTSDSTSVPAQAAAVEDPLVGSGLKLVGAVQPLLVAVEGVGVLHRELAGAQDAGPRSRLVALLGLDVEEHQRQVAVGADLAGDVVVTASSWVIASTIGDPLRSSSLNSSSIA